jgi:hypothetical protein
MHAYQMFFFWGEGVNFHHLATEKKLNVTHKKVLCEKECTKIIRFKKDFFSEIAIFTQ